MKAVRAAHEYEQLRVGRVWMLLAADKSPLVTALLQSLFNEEDKTLQSSVFHERLTRDLESLRAQGHSLPQSAQAYVAAWLEHGWLTRRFPVGASEEEFEMTGEAAAALRFIDGLLKPRTTATESRLASVMQQVIRLAEETDTNPKTRMASLLAERARVDADIQALERGGVKALPDERAIERAREVIVQAEELAGDFRNVRDAFDRLNRDLRQSLMENDGSRGDVLEHLFAGVDLVAESEPGRTFTAFWRLLTDGTESSNLSDALDAVTSRSFARQLAPRERKFLQNLTGTLMEEGGGVHDVLQQFARSLKSFVQSREFQEQRRLHSLLKQSQLAALAAKPFVRPTAPLDYSLTLTSSRIRSVSQWNLLDPKLLLPDSSMADADVSEFNLDQVEELVRQSEIDLRTLKEHVREVLLDVSQATVGEMLQRFPAEQGFGSVIGYVSLGAKHGEVTQQLETVGWPSADGVFRTARVPTIYFLRNNFLELHD